jgi:hypothetical protein
MLNKRIVRVLLRLALAITASGSLKHQAANSPLAQHVFFRVQVAASVPASLNGRLLMFVKKGTGEKEVNTDEFHLETNWVAAEEVRDLEPGASIAMDGANATSITPSRTRFPSPLQLSNRVTLAALCIERHC